MGLDIYLYWDGKTDGDQQAQYKANSPEEYAKAGYLRSSYNECGFNSWAARHLGGKDLYYVFEYSEGKEQEEGEPDEDGYRSSYFHPDWTACRKRALELVALAETVPPYKLIRVSTPIEVYPRDQVLTKYLDQHSKHQERDDGRFSWYSSRMGDFYAKDPPTVIGVMWQQGYGRTPEPVLIVGNADHSYYQQFTRAIVDFIDFAMTKPNPRMSWSG